MRDLIVVFGCSLFYSDASADGVEEIACSALSLVRSAQAERGNESCFTPLLMLTNHYLKNSEEIETGENVRVQGQGLYCECINISKLNSLKIYWCWLNGEPFLINSDRRTSSTVGSRDPNDGFAQP
ncbi:hypothetical protein EVAR_102264_1 [Eumeta japonica]|uniref:Ig-like domain-containing protein n=1 Tax=Eumeta variegata TaxID=151549 RepID=A0A4C1ZNA8_EUMVA|nr:hypothetical protein EVAR_102264_1 [Eumeta japonica]